MARVCALGRSHASSPLNRPQANFSCALAHKELADTFDERFIRVRPSAAGNAKPLTRADYSLAVWRSPTGPSAAFTTTV
jgi:hypothetical protein